MSNGSVSPAGSRSSKLSPWHLDRLAVVYVRQSSAQQVVENRESTQRQYALVDRAVELGWPRERVIVIDEDQGKSGSTAEGRLGFQRLLAEVSLDHVGLILGIEMSRLARSCKDWHQLLELCSVFRALLADQDGLYDPTDPNDRLLLGLKGTMSEAELHVLRGRLRHGLMNKVRRGEVFLNAPTGYVRSPNGVFELDPDEQAQGAIRMIFDLFERHGRARVVVKQMLEQGVRIAVRTRSGPDRGRIEWRPPSMSTVMKILKHPLYAGYYVYGRHRTDPRRRTRSGRNVARRRVSREGYAALIPNGCPAYITADQFEANQQQLAENRSRHQYKGAPREGTSLLAGLIRCGRCGRRMNVVYSGKSSSVRYVCNRTAAVERPCDNEFGGDVLDNFVGQQVLSALQPAALELSLAAVADVIRDQATIDQNWRQRVERAQFEANRAERQYHTVEPENRLVARTLEKRWENALKIVRQLEEEYDRFQRNRPVMPTEEERERIRSLARDLPTLWDASTTRPIDRKEIIRIVVEEVRVETRANSERVTAAITWVGGHKTEHHTTRRVKRYEQMADFPLLVKRVRELHATCKTCEAIAEQLNAEGFHPPYGKRGFWKKTVGNFIRKHLPDLCGKSTGPRHYKKLLQPSEWSVGDLAKRLGISNKTIYDWIELGWINVRSIPGIRPIRICWADEKELERLAELRNTPRRWYDPPLPIRLTSPKAIATHSAQ